MKRRARSGNKGSVVSLAFIAVVPLVAAIGGFAVDCMHVNDAKGELQRATDAAALAGAEDLSNYVGTKNTTSTAVSTANEEPVNFALTVASLNAVDGPIGLWQSGQRTVSSTILYDATLSGPVNRPNRCNVTGSIQIRSLFAQIFGNFGQTVTTTSSAGLTPLNTLYSYLPLLVSWVDADPNGRILSDQAVNSEYTVEIKDMQVSSNSVWTENSGKVLKDAIAHIADPTNNPGNGVTEHSIGDVIKSNNGQKGVGKDFESLIGKDVAFLVTNDSANNPLLAQGKPEHTVTGFMVLHIDTVDANSKKDGYNLSGTLRPVANGGGYNPNKPQTTITTFAPFLVRLIQ